MTKAGLRVKPLFSLITWHCCFSVLPPASGLALWTNTYTSDEAKISCRTGYKNRVRPSYIVQCTCTCSVNYVRNACMYVRVHVQCTYISLCWKNIYNHTGQNSPLEMGISVFHSDGMFVMDENCTTIELLYDVYFRIETMKIYISFKNNNPKKLDFAIRFIFSDIRYTTPRRQVHVISPSKGWNVRYSWICNFLFSAM